MSLLKNLKQHHLEHCDDGILEDGKQYYIKTTDGRFVVFDANKNLAFVEKVGINDASRFTAFQKSCNVYGLCVGGFCMSRCEQCSSDVDDFQTVKFFRPNSCLDNVVTQFTLTSSTCGNGTYSVQVEGSNFLTYQQTDNGDQLTLCTDLNNDTLFEFIEVEPDCDVLADGKQYYIQSIDGRFVVFDKVKNIAFMRKVPLTCASKFTAYKKCCNVYVLCAEGSCMSKCDQCTSDVGDFETIKFFLSNNCVNNIWSSWTITSSIAGGPYNLRVNDKSFMTYKRTLWFEDQLTLTSKGTLAGNEPQFLFVDAT